MSTLRTCRAYSRYGFLHDVADIVVTDMVCNGYQFNLFARHLFSRLGRTPACDSDRHTDAGSWSQVPIRLEHRGVYGNDARTAEERSSKGRDGWVLGGGMLTFPPARGICRSTVSCPRVRPGDGATRRFTTLYKSANDVDFLLILNLFQ